MKYCSRLAASLSLSLLFAITVDAGICFAGSDVQASCSFKSYSVAELTPEYEASLGMSDEYKTPQLRLRHLAEIKHRQTGSSNPDFLKFKSIQVDGLLDVFSDDSSNQLIQLPKMGDVEFVFWESHNPYFNKDFWFPKYIDIFFAAPDKLERFFDSPWLKIRLNPTTCKFRILSLWNVRQFIADEAFVSGSTAIKVGITTAQNDTARDLPMEFNQEVIGARYYSSEVGGLNEKITLLEKIKAGQAERLKTAKSHLPPELYWLFSSIKTHLGLTGTGTFASLLVRRMEEISIRASNDLVAISKVVVRKIIQSEERSITIVDAKVRAKLLGAANQH
jgi:hypothetical protein